MKKAMIIFMALATFAISAQNKNDNRPEHRKQLRENLTPEQRAELHTKKLTLDLNLNETQQIKVNQLLLNMQKDKPNRSKNRKDMTDEEKYEAKSAMLDKRIEMKKAMKEILTDAQFTKWEKASEHNRRKMRSKNALNKRGEK
ncbi:MULTISPECIES: hypothetical protein [Aequorivita]|uniref:DUF4890 domain-containing protein n=2 Tax=Aequorivita TaxID=153265 RepID=A0AB35YSE8_9FLAO|nr:hypothetical protein [Aequorivita sp. Ant34-E75]WGF93106.1 hypothetical protein QCQ61_02715 [Aequorivita sp. Ant34-E75]